MKIYEKKDRGVQRCAVIPCTMGVTAVPRYVTTPQDRFSKLSRLLHGSSSGGADNGSAGTISSTAFRNVFVWPLFLLGVEYNGRFKRGQRCDILRHVTDDRQRAARLALRHRQAQNSPE